MSEMTKKNELNWDDRVDIHLESEGYPIQSFQNGKTTLKSVELAALGDVKGKSILHLQCHFGLDTLSLARMGAKVTGMDLSTKAINAARAIAADQKLEAEFIACDLYDLPQHLDRQFDIVLTSYGVLCWLSDLPRWGEIINRFLKDGGTFLIVESHPVADSLLQQGNDYSVGYSYFDNGPQEYDNDKTYVSSDKKLTQTITYQWSHSVADIMTALLAQGLRIEKFDEYPYTFFNRFPVMERDAAGWFILPGGRKDIPLMFSLIASKRAE